MCCFFLVCSRLPCSPLSTSASFPLLCTEGWPCARQDAVQGIGGQYESASITSLLPVATASKGSAAFPPSLLPGCACTAAAGMLLCPVTHAAGHATAPLLLGQLGPEHGLQMTAHVHPRLLPPASSPAMTLSRGLLFFFPWSPFSLSKMAFPLHLRTWGIWFFCWKDEGLLHACPFPLGNCYSFHFSLIQSDHLSRVLLGKCSAKPVCSNLHL